MSVNILMPALSPTMEKGNLAKWLKKEGDKVKAGDVIAEIETDKATMEYESIEDGVLAKIVVPEGTQDVAVNQLIAVLAGEGEDPKAAADAAAAVGKGAGAAKPPAIATASPVRGEAATPTPPPPTPPRQTPASSPQGQPPAMALSAVTRGHGEAVGPHPGFPSPLPRRPCQDADRAHAAHPG